MTLGLTLATPRPDRHATVSGAGETVSGAEGFWAATLLMGSYLLPSEMAVKVGVVLTGLRLALFVLLVWSLAALLRKLAARDYVLVLSDLTVVLLVVWMEVSLYAVGGSVALASALGVRPIEFLSAYLAGRCLFGSRLGLTSFVRVLLWIVGALVVLGMLDVVAGENILGSLALKYFAVDRHTLYVTQYRMGLPRARASFEHAILFGTFFAACAPLFYYLAEGTIRKFVGVLLCAAGTLLSLSSAPILAFGIFAAIATFDGLLRKGTWRWAALGGLTLYGLALLFVLVDDPLRTLIESFTLDPSTGVYRFLIWEWIGFNLQSSPWFGLGGADWVRLPNMVSSVDALWLGQALGAGYVGVVLLALSVVSPFFVWTSGRAVRDQGTWLRTSGKAVTISIVQMTFISMTVFYWGTCWAFFALLIGIRAGLSEGRYLLIKGVDRGLPAGVAPSGFRQIAASRRPRLTGPMARGPRLVANVEGARQ